MSGEPVFERDGLSVAFDTPDGTVAAVRDVSMTVNGGETAAVAGESGAGKATLGRALLRLLP